MARVRCDFRRSDGHLPDHDSVPAGTCSHEPARFRHDDDIRGGVSRASEIFGSTVTMGMASTDSLVAFQYRARDDGYWILRQSMESDARTMDSCAGWNACLDWRVLFHRQHLANRRHRLSATRKHNERAKGSASEITNRLKALAPLFASAASSGANARPHRVKEYADSGDLRERRDHDEPSYPGRSHIHTEQLSNDSRGCSNSEQPVRDLGNSGLISLVFLVGARKKPERNTENHHHHESNEDGVRVRAHDVARRI